MLHGGDSASRKNDSVSQVASPVFPLFECCRVEAMSSRVDSMSWRADSVMEELDELFIQLGESKAIFLSSRTTRRVVHMTRRVGCRLSEFLDRESTLRVDAILDE